MSADSGSHLNVARRFYALATIDSAAAAALYIALGRPLVRPSGNNLVESARLAIGTVRQRERIAADASARFRLNPHQTAAWLRRSAPIVEEPHDLGSRA